MGAMLAHSQSPVLNFGETGTGKELFADTSQIKWKTANICCRKRAALPDNLVESILFGKKRFFYRAINDQVGNLQQQIKEHTFLMIR
jgi:arginine utilization regulatory protein